MKLDIRLSLSAELHRTFLQRDNGIRGDGMADKDFIKKSTDKLKGDIEKSNREAEVVLQKLDAIKAHAPEQWKLLRQWVEDYCEQANLDMGYEAFAIRRAPSNQLNVDLRFTKEADRGRLLQVEFSEATGVITYDKSRHYFKPIVDMNGFGFSDGSHAVSVEEMGQILIKTLLDMR
jgi:hypothetical protein